MVGKHPVVHGIYIFRLHVYVAIDDEVKLCPVIGTLAQSDVMRAPVTQVLLHRHVSQFVGAEPGSEGLFLLCGLRLAIVRFGVVQEINLPQVLNAQQFLHKRHHLLFPSRTI